MRRGLILLAHGARDPRWREPFEQLAERDSRQATRSSRSGSRFSS